jgi:uncharacterized protein (DUF1697 family)
MTPMHPAPPAPRWVALLRGINVGKAKRIAMADLRALLVSLGCSRVHTLLNSGNAVFDAPADSVATQAQHLRAAVAAELGVDAPVLIKSAQDMAAAVAGNALALSGRDPSRLLVVFTPDARSLAALAALAPLASAPEQWLLGPHAAYLWCANGVLNSPLARALLKAPGQHCTTRNWATVEKLQALLTQAD